MGQKAWFWSGSRCHWFRVLAFKRFISSISSHQCRALFGGIMDTSKWRDGTSFVVLIRLSLLLVQGLCCRHQLGYTLQVAPRICWQQSLRSHHGLVQFGKEEENTIDFHLLPSGRKIMNTQYCATVGILQTAFLRLSGCQFIRGIKMRIRFALQVPPFSSSSIEREFQNHSKTEINGSQINLHWDKRVYSGAMMQWMLGWIDGCHQMVWRCYP